MKKLYDRICFAPDDNGISGGPLGEPPPKGISSDIGELFGEITESPALAPNLPTPPVEPSLPTEPTPNQGENTPQVPISSTPEVSAPPTETDLSIPILEATPNTLEPKIDVNPEVPPTAPIVPGESTPPVPEASAEILALREQLANLTAQVAAVAPQVAPEPPLAEVPVTDLSSLVTDEEFEQAMESRAGFLQLLSKAIAKSQASVTDHIMTNIPTVVGNFVQRQSVLKDVAKEFYAQNPELKRVKRYVSQVANEVSAEHPEWELGKVLTESAVRAKTTLGIVANTQQSTPPSSGPTVGTTAPPAAPTLPGGTGGSRRPTPPIAKLQSEIDNLITD